MTTPSLGSDGPASDRAEPDHTRPDRIPSDEISPETFRTVQGSEEFAQLRRSFRGFAIPMTVAFLVWYLAYVLLSTYAEGFMSIQVIGNLNLGIILGLSQFLMTFLITWLYIRHANRSLDPISTRIRDELEGAN